tara:strand:+ start:111 stop:806 length:696 start_codon:yes stop_codon:yes gene_type:complete
MNNIYIFLFLATTILASTNYPKYNYINSTEQEKEINEEKLYSKINRHIDFYSYDILIGQSVPINKNTANNFQTGELISLCIKTPYKSPKILNRFTFNISSEISIKNFKFKPEGSYESNYNIFTVYLILNNLKDEKNKISYGIGTSHINQGDNNSLSPSFKLNLERRIDFNKFYALLTNSHILNKKDSIENFLKNLNISLGTSPEVILSFPNKKGQTTLSSDIYIKINLFNL